MRGYESCGHGRSQMGYGTRERFMCIVTTSSLPPHEYLKLSTI